MPRVLGGLTLAVIKIGRHGDDRFGHFFAQIVLRGLLHLLKNHRRHLGWAIALPADLDMGVAVASLDHLVRETLQRFLDLRAAELATHEPLDGIDRVFRVGDRLAFGDLADEPFSFVRDRDD